MSLGLQVSSIPPRADRVELAPRVKLVEPRSSYGLIEGADGHDLYFHLSKVIGMDFVHLQPGDYVRFVEERAEDGATRMVFLSEGKPIDD